MIRYITHGETAEYRSSGSGADIIVELCSLIHLIYNDYASEVNGGMELAATFKEVLLLGLKDDSPVWKIETNLFN